LFKSPNAITDAVVALTDKEPSLATRLRGAIVKSVPNTRMLRAVEAKWSSGAVEAKWSSRAVEAKLLSGGQVVKQVP
jgi:hypothetical protein